MKIHDVFQGSLQWLELRSGIPTASEFHNLVTPKWKVREGEIVRTYLATKLAERWIHGPLPGFSSFPTEQGKLREERAIPWFEAEYGMALQRPGFITRDDGRIGCSPDGLFDDGTGIEVKCPEPHTHVKYLLANVVPDDYLAQVHGSMLVTGAERWTFLSYCPRFPALVLSVQRDNALLDFLQTALDDFLDDLDSAYATLVERNGGPPPKRTSFKPSANDDPRSHLFEGLPGEHDHLHITP